MQPDQLQSTLFLLPLTFTDTMSSPDLEALLRMAATMGLGPDVIKQVRANPDMLRRLAEGVRASASSGITSPASSTETDMQDLLKQHADAARAVAEREKRLPPRHPPRKDRDDQMREMEAGRRQAMEVQSVGEKGFQFSFIGMPKASSLVPLSKLQPSQSLRSPSTVTVTDRSMYSRFRRDAGDEDARRPLSRRTDRLAPR